MKTFENSIDSTWLQIEIVAVNSYHSFYATFPISVEHNIYWEENAGKKMYACMIYTVYLFVYCMKVCLMEYTSKSLLARIMIWWFFIFVIWIDRLRVPVCMLKNTLHWIKSASVLYFYKKKICRNDKDQHSAYREKYTIIILCWILNSFWQ